MSMEITFLSMDDDWLWMLSCDDRCHEILFLALYKIPRRPTHHLLQNSSRPFPHVSLLLWWRRKILFLQNET